MFSIEAAQDANNPFHPIYVIIGGALLGIFLDLIHRFVLPRLAAKTAIEKDDKIIVILRKPLFWSVFLGSIYLALKPLLSPENVVLSFRLLSTVSAGIWLWAGAKIADVLFEEIPFAKNMAKIGGAMAVAIAVMFVWQLDITPALASAGVAGVAVAFAAKDTVANFFGGVSVFLDKSYKVGDYIIVENQYRGEVLEIGIRSTKVRTPDNMLITIPNSTMVTNAVVNETGFDPKFRIRVKITVALGSDLDLVERIMVETLKENENILDTEEPKVRYREFGESGVELEAMGLIESPVVKNLVRHQVIKQLNAKIKEKGIEIPYARREIYVKSENNGDMITGIV